MSLEEIQSHFRGMPASDLHHMLRAFAAEAASRVIDLSALIQEHIASGAGVSVEVVLSNPPSFSVMLVDSNEKRVVVARIPISGPPLAH